MGKYEMTQAQWRGRNGLQPVFFPGGCLEEGVESSDLPLERVSWEDVVEFSVVSGFSLPSEPQWEYV